MSDQAAAAGADIRVTLPDGNTMDFPRGTIGRTVAERISGRLAREALAMRANGRVLDISTPLVEDVELRFLSFDDPDGLEVFRHSSAHLLAHAVRELFPEAHPTIGPVVDEGFYYDFAHRPFAEDDLAKIEARMRDIMGRKLPIERVELSKEEALRVFADNPFKVEMIRELEEGTITAYRQGDFIDLCRGPHVQNTGQVKAFKLVKLAGAYWRGDAAREQLQRIYGVSFPDPKLLKAHLDRLEEAKRRDHRRIGKDMELFSFQDEGPGFPFWHPAGMTVKNEMVAYWREVHRRYGYVEIQTPQMLSEVLWRQSGHWDNYRQNMYFSQIDEHPFALKPMNCPGGILVFRSRRHSYRELPMRVGELGLVHRHELSGVLQGLFRVRAFTQDDAHIYCTEEQAPSEVAGVIRLVKEIYGTFGFTDVRVELSTRPAKRIGTEAAWDLSEAALRQALETEAMAYQINPGDGAFYGPKIDFHVRDCMGRSWQCGTIQLDMNLPERFDMVYEGADGSRHRPVMIHRAVYGSLERFIGIQIEHFEGKFPLWMAPEQLRVLPVADRHLDYARRVVAELEAAGLRATLDERSEGVSRKVRDAQLARVNYQLVVGDREAEDATVSVRTRANRQLGVLSIADMRDRALAEVRTRALPDDFARTPAEPATAA